MNLFVVIPRLHKLNTIGKYAINQPMFMINSPTPATGEFMLKRFRLSNTRKGIGKNRLHQVKNPQRSFMVCLNPSSQIFLKVR